jgi:hypothetical protein
VLHAFEAWTNFYVIVGSSAGALTGLQFVVVALITDTHDTRGFASTSAAFATPTVVHFGFVLVLSAILAAPWTEAGVPMVVIGASGVVGVIYSMLIARRARRQGEYQPVLEDWLFHVGIPGLAYLSIALAALESRVHLEGALFAIGASTLLLLIVGIHNAWDTVTFIVARQANKHPPESRSVRRSRGTPEE